jgi:hypothetical protein
VVQVGQAPAAIKEINPNEAKAKAKTQGMTKKEIA